MNFDPFGDFETAGYLRNSLGLKDPEDVKRSEHLAFELSINDALDFLAEVASVDYESIRHVHNILFSEFYPWAGQDRNELVPGLAVFKGSADNPRHTTFEHPKGIKHAIDYALQLASDHEHFKKRPGEVMGLLAFAHPFLDGNGRTILLVFMELSYRAGFAIDWSGTNKDDYLRTLSAEIETPARGHLDCYLAPYIVEIASRDQWAELIGAIKGLDGLDKENISYGSLDDPEIKKRYTTGRYAISGDEPSDS